MSEHNVFPTEELNQRLSNVRSQMVEANVDGVVITIPENIYYLTELDHWGFFACHSGFAELVINEKTDFTIPHATYFHYLHHKYFECNYGDLTIPFDKWFGSFHDGSKELHEKLFIKNRKIN